MPGYQITDAHEKRKPVLIVNSYAGSLTIAAHAMGHKVVGSYEDAGYGLEVQRTNFPAVDYRSVVSEWPVRKSGSLAGHLVIAHPPCTAFSSMTISLKGKHGLEAEKFQCTVRVLEYALGAGCDALAVESVVGAYEGARSVHEAYAKKHGYKLYRVLQNACTFGLPQWRERFWALFVRDDLGNDLIVKHDPRPAVIADILGDGGDVNELLSRKWAEQFDKLKSSFGKKVANELMVRRTHGTGALGAVVKRYLGKRGIKRELIDVSKEHVVWGAYQSNTPRVLDPNGLAPVLLHHSFWTVNGRVLTETEYKRVMGFPDHYQFPGKHAKLMKGYLSRGVCPPVAAWVLNTLDENVNPKRRKKHFRRAGSIVGSAFLVEPGGTADLRPARQLWTQVLADHTKERR